MADRDGAALDRLAGELGEAATPQVTDLLDADSCDAMVPEALAKAGRIDILHCNASSLRALMSMAGPDRPSEDACLTHPEVDCPRWDEADRLKALTSYGVLDTTPEGSFDDLASLAARICEAPMAAVSLVDSQRQWFKSEVGLGVRETPRPLSFCAHAM